MTYPTGKKEETDDKAMLAYSLTRQGMKKTEIAVYMGISRDSVHRLLRRSKAIFRWMADNIDGKLHLAETLDAFIKQEETALANAAACDLGSSVAVQWANAARDARKEIKKLLQECGAVFKMPEQIEDGIPFDDPEIRKDYLALRARARAKAGIKDEVQEGEGT
jgi:plasmid maintenance system antidote protein VapI